LAINTADVYMTAEAIWMLENRHRINNVKIPEIAQQAYDPQVTQVFLEDPSS
jgi:hypothetical protein